MRYAIYKPHGKGFKKMFSGVNNSPTFKLEELFKLCRLEKFEECTLAVCSSKEQLPQYLRGIKIRKLKRNKKIFK